MVEPDSPSLLLKPKAQILPHWRGEYPSLDGGKAVLRSAKAPADPPGDRSSVAASALPAVGAASFDSTSTEPSALEVFYLRIKVEPPNSFERTQRKKSIAFPLERAEVEQTELNHMNLVSVFPSNAFWLLWLDSFPGEQIASFVATVTARSLPLAHRL